MHSNLLRPFALFILLSFFSPLLFAQNFLATSNCTAPNDDPRIGVTTFDLVLITQHILGNQYLDSPYKIIAADANKSNSVTTFDMVEIRKLILFIETEFATNTSWRFIDSSYVFLNPANPFSSVFPECIHVDLTNENAVINRSFIAVKVGDVNNSVQLCNASPFAGSEIEDRSGKIGLTMVSNNSLTAGVTATLDFFIKAPKELVSWEMGLLFDTRYLAFEEAVSGELEGMNSGCFGLTQAGEGKFRALWVAPFAQPFDFKDGYQAFSLKFKALKPVEDLASVLFLDDSVLPGRAYEHDGTANGFNLTFATESPLPSNQGEASSGLSVTAVPNPFSGRLSFFVTVPYDDWLEVAVFDVNGRQVASWNGETVAKEKEVVFTQTNDWGEGVFTYRVRTAQYSMTGKITKQ